MSTPHSDRAAWTIILLCELQAGRSRYQGPPGLKVRVESLWYSLSEAERHSLHVDRGAEQRFIDACLNDA